ncbi:MAG: class I SAM-dependent methyltransferase [Betaproteobacteria bacterium]|nr:class I SAM-dependent methyltransferase [Betaproteobacteria bacterium]
MHRSTPRATCSFHAIVLAALVLTLPAAALAQSAAKPGTDYQPSVGQEGKDVIWVPTPQALVERMLQMANTKPDDYVVDLGSGDGRTVIAAAKKFGARALGIEYNADMVTLSQRTAEKEGVAGRAQFVRGDIFESDFSQATVLTLYLLPNLNIKLRPTILKMKPGTRVVSHAFSMQEWQPDQTESVEGRTAYLWIVPAPVEGTWRWSVSTGGPRDYELTLRQYFQHVEGLVRLDGNMGQVRDVKLNGDGIRFSIYELTGSAPVRRDFIGRISGDTMKGKVKRHDGGPDADWTATRTPSAAAPAAAAAR